MLQEKATVISGLRSKLYERKFVKTEEEACKVIAVIDVLLELNELVNGNLKEIVNLMFEGEQKR
jgi:hypothetical protein